MVLFLFIMRIFEETRLNISSKILIPVDKSKRFDETLY